MNSKHIGLPLIFFIITALVISISSTAERKIVWSGEDSLQLIALPGPAARPYAQQIVGLDLKTYKEWPYLYEGAMEDGLGYFETYFQSKNSLFLLLMKEKNVFGYAALIPLQEEMEKLKKPMTQAGLRCEEYMYIGSVVIEKEYRHKGIMRIMCEQADAYAKKRGKRYSLLNTIERETDNPHRPAGDRPLGGLWKHLGFEKMVGMTCPMRWSNSITHTIEPVTIGYWRKKIEGSAL